MRRLCRALIVFGTLAAIWATVVALSGGFVLSSGFIRLSSRSPRNAVLAALLSWLGVWALSTTGARRRIREELLLWWQRLRGADAAVLFALAGVGFTISQWAGARPLWLDEEMIALNLRDRPLLDLAGPLWLGQSAPFGWLAVQRLVVLGFGTSEHAMRFVPALFGIATLAAAVWVARRWMGLVGAVVLLLLCSFGQWLSLYSLELKHYSGDTFWALLLPALGAWTIEADQNRPTFELRRAAVWWAAAAVGHWLANGALLVTPGCALVLLVLLWRRHGRRAALPFALLGFLWVASFGLHYLVAVRHTLNSEYLSQYWSFALPPASSGLTGTLSWLAGRLEPLALKPGGSTLWVMFWVAAASGFALSPSPALGALLATVPLSAFVLAIFRLVPLNERLSLWIIPALYIGIAFFCDSASRFGRDGYVRRKWPRLALAIAIAVIGSRLCWDIVSRGKDFLQTERPAKSNHELDDRAAVQWLMRQHQTGDVLMATRLAIPAIWWYGRIPISDSNFAGSRQADGSPILEVQYKAPGPDCQRSQLRETLEDAPRVLVYFGFRFDDVPEGFDGLLLDSLGELGVISEYQGFAGVGRAAVIDLRSPPFNPDQVPIRSGAGPANARERLSGCLVAQQARRW